MRVKYVVGTTPSAGGCVVGAKYSRVVDSQAPSVILKRDTAVGAT